MPDFTKVGQRPPNRCSPRETPPPLGQTRPFSVWCRTNREKFQECQRSPLSGRALVLGGTCPGRHVSERGAIFGETLLRRRGGRLSGHRLYDGRHLVESVEMLAWLGGLQGSREGVIKFCGALYHRASDLPNRQQAPVKSMSEVGTLRLVRKNDSNISHIHSLFFSAGVKTSEIWPRFSTTVTFEWPLLRKKATYRRVRKTFIEASIIVLCPP